jgi:hypothetical protein
VESAGWLVVDPACIRTGDATATCPPRPPFLADATPLPDGTLRKDAGLEVTLSPDLWGVDRAAGPVTPGPFLLAPPTEDGGPWQVVARYDPSRSVRVVIP